MEDWQKQHVEKNLVELIKNTICNAHLLNTLKAAEILPAADLERLQLPNLTAFKKSKKLYEILVSISGSYDALVKCLEETRQSRALRILKEHKILYHFVGSISYDQNHELGQGSSGSKIFKGLFDGRDVAVKKVNSFVISAEEILHELDFLKKLDNHQNILRYHFAETQENYVCIAMELCAISLKDEMKLSLLRMNPITILKKCAKGLAHIHKHNIIHGNMRPANILLNHDNQVKISDFGLAKQIPSGMTTVAVHPSVETIDWMAPEIMQPVLDEEESNQPLQVGTSADIFSLGCIFYYVLTKGTHPFGNGAAIQYNICCHNPQLQFCKIDTSWLHLVEQMISEVPSHRPSCENILASNCFNMHENNINKRLSYSGPSPTFSNLTFDLKPVPTGNNDSGYASNPPNILNITPSSAPDVIKESLGKIQENNQVTRMEKIINEELPKPEILTMSYNPEAERSKIMEFTSDLNNKDDNGDNAVFRAVRSGLRETELEIFVKLGGEWKARNIHGHSILHLAAEYGNIDALNYFINLGADLDARDNNQETILHRISYAKQNFKESLGILLQNKLNINAVNKNGNNLIFLAAVRGRSKEELEDIVKLGGDWQIKTKNGTSILHRAAEGGNVQALKYFIKLGADVNAKTRDGETPLHRVRFAKQNFLESVDELLIHGADPNATTNTRETLYMMLLNSGGYNELSVLKNYGIKYDCCLQ